MTEIVADADRRENAPGNPSPARALGIDVGSTNTKIALIDIDARPVLEVATRTFATPDDARVLVIDIDAAVADLTARFGRPIVVGIASMAETGVIIDRADEPITDLLRWNRSDRADRMSDIEMLDERFGVGGLFALTGVPTLPKVPMVAWAHSRRTGGPLSDPTTRWAGVADLVTLALTESLVTDHTLAGRTGAYLLPNAGGAVPGGFDPQLLEAVGLAATRLPSIATPGEIAGLVSAPAARRTGLGEGTPVFVAGHDHAVGAWAAGVREPGDVADSLGTSEALIRVAGASLNRAEVSTTGMSIVRTVGGDREALLAGSPAGGGLVSHWFTDVVSADRDSILAEITQMLPAVSGLIVLPYPFGRQAPLPDHAQRLITLDHDGNPADLSSYRAVESTLALLEGLSLHVRWLHNEQQRLAGGRCRSVIVIGGQPGSDDPWLQIKASVLRTPVERVAVSTPVASGAALLAAVRLGVVEPDVALPHVTIPADSYGDYDDRFDRFVRAASIPGGGGGGAAGRRTTQPYDPVAS